MASALLLLKRLSSPTPRSGPMSPVSLECPELLSEGICAHLNSFSLSLEGDGYFCEFFLFMKPKGPTQFHSCLSCWGSGRNEAWFLPTRTQQIEAGIVAQTIPWQREEHRDRARMESKGSSADQVAPSRGTPWEGFGEER